MTLNSKSADAVRAALKPQPSRVLTPPPQLELDTSHGFAWSPELVDFQPTDDMVVFGLTRDEVEAADARAKLWWEGHPHGPSLRDLKMIFRQGIATHKVDRTMTTRGGHPDFIRVMVCAVYHPLGFGNH